MVVGHWLVAAPHVTGDGLRPGSLLVHRPWTQWLTWAFQVMPVFFVVVGFANAASWNAARRSGRGYGAWLYGRLQRLIGPVFPLLAIWVLLGATAAPGSPPTMAWCVPDPSVRSTRSECVVGGGSRG